PVCGTVPIRIASAVEDCISKSRQGEGCYTSPCRARRSPAVTAAAAGRGDPGRDRVETGNGIRRRALEAGLAEERPARAEQESQFGVQAAAGVVVEVAVAADRGPGLPLLLHLLLDRN